MFINKENNRIVSEKYRDACGLKREESGYNILQTKSHPRIAILIFVTLLS